MARKHARIGRQYGLQHTFVGPERTFNWSTFVKWVPIPRYAHNAFFGAKRDRYNAPFQTSVQFVVQNIRTSSRFPLAGNSSRMSIGNRTGYSHEPIGSRLAKAVGKHPIIVLMLSGTFGSFAADSSYSMIGFVW